MFRGVGICAVMLVLAFAGTAEAAMLTPTSKDYGSQTVGTTGAATQFLLTTSATGCQPDGMGGCLGGIPYATNTSALGGPPGTTVTSGDFSIHNVDCDYPSLSSGILPFSLDSCFFQVSFAPTATGPRAATLNFPDEGGPTASLALSGTGLAPPVTAAPPPTRKKCKKGFKPVKVNGKKKCKRKKKAA